MVTDITRLTVVIISKYINIKSLYCISELIRFYVNYISINKKTSHIMPNSVENVQGIYLLIVTTKQMNVMAIWNYNS